MTYCKKYKNCPSALDNCCLSCGLTQHTAQLVAKYNLLRNVLPNWPRNTYHATHHAAQHNILPVTHNMLRNVLPNALVTKHKCCLSVKHNCCSSCGSTQHTAQLVGKNNLLRDVLANWPPNTS